MENRDISSTSSLESIVYDVEQNLSTELNVQSSNRISNSREYKFIQRRKLDHYTILCIKSFIVFIILLFNFPLCITELYYAFTDNSCVHIKNNKFHIDLYTYLVVDGLYGIILSLLCSIYICCFIDFDKTDLSFITKLIIDYISYILLLFNLSWTIVGCIVFWLIIEFNICDNNIYTFVFAELIIKVIFLFIQITKLTNKK